MTVKVLVGGWMTTSATERVRVIQSGFYLVSAMRRNAPLVTVDKRFINRLANTRYKSHVIHLADWT